jgi:hypothetical protein
MSIGEVVDIDTSIRLIMEAFAERKECLIQDLKWEIEFYEQEASLYSERGISESAEKAHAEASFRRSMIDRIREI